jgi:hypothetical protein
VKAVLNHGVRGGGHYSQKLSDFDEEFGANCGVLPCWVERCLLIGRKILFVLLRSHGKNDDECCDSKSCPS